MKAGLWFVWFMECFMEIRMECEWDVMGINGGIYWGITDILIGSYWYDIYPFVFNHSDGTNPALMIWTQRRSLMIDAKEMQRRMSILRQSERY